MWLRLHTKKSFTNDWSSISSPEANLGGEEEPEYVEFCEDKGCTREMRQFGIY